MLGMQTRKARLHRAVQAVRDYCRRHRHEPIAVQHVGLVRRLTGHLNYFGIQGNGRRLACVIQEVRIPRIVISRSAEHRDRFFHGIVIGAKRRGVGQSVVGGVSFRREGPDSMIRWALWRARSQMASAMVGSPRWSCQDSVGSWLVRDRGAGAVAVFEDLQQVAPIDVPRGRQCPVVHNQQVDAGDALQVVAGARVRGGEAVPPKSREALRYMAR